MPSAKRSITIRRPVDEVFAFVADGANGPKWRSGVLDIAHEAGAGVGARYKQGVKGPMGRRIAADYEITTFEAGKRLAFRATAGPVRPTGEYRFSAANDATNVSFSLDAQLGFLKRLLMGRSVQRTMDAEMRALDKLKSLLEGDDPAAKAAKPAAKAVAKSAATSTPEATARRPRASAAKAGPKPTSRRSPKK